MLWGHSGAHFAELAARYGYILPGLRTQAEVRDYVEGSLRRLALPAALAVFLLSLGPPLAAQYLHINPTLASFCGPVLLALGAASLEIHRQLRAHLEMAEPGVDASEEPEGNEDWTDVFVTDVELEARMVQRALGRRKIRSVVHSDRWLALAGTLSFWEWSRPEYPSLTLHHRLADGRISLKVPRSCAEDAGRAIAEIRAEAAGAVPASLEPTGALVAGTIPAGAVSAAASTTGEPRAR
jgi:hypothetical protein